MKRYERKLLDAFSDDNMQIDSQFKEQLRSQLTRKQAAHEKKKRSGWGWAKFAAVPAVFLVALTAFAITGTDNVRPDKPFGSSKVSAAELIRRSEEYTKKLDLSQYNYFEDSMRTELVADTAIRCGMSDLQQGPWADATFRSYLYRADDGGVEAYYRAFDGPGSIGTPLQIYDTSQKRVLPDDLVPQAKTLHDWIDGRQEGSSHRAFYVTNMYGERISDDSIDKTELDGKEVYVFYTITDFDKPASAGLQENNCGTQIQKNIVDAKTYNLIRQETYVGSAVPENLLSITESTIIYDTISAKDALSRMEAVGFDRNTAEPAYRTK